MIVANNVSSKGINSFGLDVNLSTVVTLNSRRDLDALSFFLKDNDLAILGGGSNILLTKSVTKPICLIRTLGKEVILERDSYDLVKIEAGEIWHELVTWAVDQGYGGIENLALIPGRCGAGPMQNIGAYGVELKDVLHSVSAYNLKDGKIYTFHNSECGFGYRTSFFKTKWESQYILLDIILKLTKPGHHQLNLSYGAISKTLEEQQISKPTIKDVANTITAIRQAKLPDPKVLGNAGSFFKNPIVGMEVLETIKKSQPEAPHYPIDEVSVKLPAGWLIDQCGWKGRKVGETGTYKNQALVLVNYGSATGQDIFDLSEDIKKSVAERFGIELIREVNVW